MPQSNQQLSTQQPKQSTLLASTKTCCENQGEHYNTDWKIIKEVKNALLESYRARLNCYRATLAACSFNFVFKLLVRPPSWYLKGSVDSLGILTN